MMRSSTVFTTSSRRETCCPIENEFQRRPCDRSRPISGAKRLLARPDAREEFDRATRLRQCRVLLLRAIFLPARREPWGAGPSIASARDRRIIRGFPTSQTKPADQLKLWGYRRRENNALVSCRFSDLFRRPTRQLLR